MLSKPVTAMLNTALMYIFTSFIKCEMKIEQVLEDNYEEIGDDHVGSSADTPMRKDAFTLSDEEKIERIKKNVSEIMHTLGLDLNDDSLSGTPNRVAKMYVKEIFGGLNPDKKPNSSTFDNKYKYGEMLVEKNITLYSTCEHHLLPIVGRAHVAYISKGTVVGLSKMNRIVDYFAKRPQVQERLNIQIVKELQNVLGTEDVACVIDAKHLCVNSRGIRDIESSTVTAEYGGKFKEEALRREFLDYINLDTEF
jgi:GTP cyclohydrolase I